jgi:hypothetical protein
MEEYTLRAFENTMLMRIFGPMRRGEDWKSEWKVLRELHGYW